MACSQCRGIESFFDEREARRKLTSYRKKGPPKTTQMLVDAISAEGVEGKTLIDVGGGVGVVQHELLKAGVKSVVSAEAATAYAKAAKDEAQRQGTVDRVDYRLGDFVDIAPDIEPADIVTLDRVICCNHDVERLVGLSASRAKRLYGLVYPHDNWIFRVAFHFMNLAFWLQRSPFRVYVHADAVVDALLQANGLRQSLRRSTLLWQVVVYTRG